jgi:transposase
MSKKTLSLDLRERVVAAVLGGMSRRQAAERFGVSAASAIRWCQRQNETGSPASYQRGGDRWSVTAVCQEPFWPDNALIGKSMI